MAKITLFLVYALLIIFSLFWNHGNATTPRKLGARHNAVTNLQNEAIFGGSKHEDSHIPSSLAHVNVVVTNEATSSKLGKRQNPIIITGLPNTNEAISSRQSSIHSFPISSSSTQKDVATHFHQLPADKDETTTRKIKNRFSSSQMWKPVQFEVTPRKLGVRHNAVTSFPNTSKATARGSRSRGSGLHMMHHLSISSSSAHTHATTPRVLGARHNVVTSLPNANEGNARELGARQNPIIITSLSSTNRETDSRESGFHSFPISSSATQTNREFPRDSDEIGHVSSIIN